MSEQTVRAYARDKHFSGVTLARWLAHAEEDREALLGLAERLRLGENQLRDILDLSDDIAARRQGSVAAVLDSAAVRGVLGRRLPRNEAIKALKLSLRRLRYPQLMAVEDRLTSLSKRLGLPAGVRIEFAENLEGEHLSIILRSCSAAELLAQAEALSAAARSEEIDQIFALLGGEW